MQTSTFMVRRPNWVKSSYSYNDSFKDIVILEVVQGRAMR